MPRRHDHRDEDRGAGSRRGSFAMDRQEKRVIARRDGEVRSERRALEDEDDGGRRTRGEGRRGVAAPEPEERRELSRREGDEARESGRGHEWSEEEAREYGRDGGRSRRASEEADGPYCAERGRGGRIGREEVGRSGAEVRWGREEEDDDRGDGRRGIATMDVEDRREIASRGGRPRQRVRLRDD